MTQEVLRVFDTVEEMQRLISPQVIGRYVISMAHQASDVMHVMFLASLTGLCGRQGKAFRLPDRGLAPVRDDPRPVAHRARHVRAARSPGLPAPAAQTWQPAGGDAGIFGFGQGRRHRGLRLAAVPRAADGDRHRQANAVYASACSTGAAAPSAGAVARPTMPFAHSPPARCWDRSSSPNRARCCRTSTATARRRSMS